MVRVWSNQCRSVYFRIQGRALTEAKAKMEWILQQFVRLICKGAVMGFIKFWEEFSRTVHGQLNCRNSASRLTNSKGAALPEYVLLLSCGMLALTSTVSLISDGAENNFLRFNAALEGQAPNNTLLFHPGSGSSSTDTPTEFSGMIFAGTEHGGGSESNNTGPASTATCPDCVVCQTQDYDPNSES